MKLTSKVTFIVLSAFAVDNLAAAAEQSKVYLQCRADSKYGDWERVVEIDRQAHTIRIVLPLIEPAPLDKDESDTYSSTTYLGGKVATRLTIDRYTLRYSIFTSLMSTHYNEGQCKEVERKI